jgi:acyl-coenzyme A synthetase/AMP-(fatty) acid ligase
MHVIDMIFFWAKTVPQRPAVMLPDMAWDYKTLADAIDSVSARIARYDLDKSEPVAVSIRSEPKFLAVCLALLRAGYSVAPVAPSLFPMLRTVGINNVISQRNALMLSGGRNVYFDDSWLTRADQTAPSSDPADYGRMVFFTSGTTGLPKKVIETKEAALERFKVSIFSGLADYSRFLVIPGLGSHFGFNLACDVLRAGRTLSFSMAVTERTLWMINAFGIEFVHASPHQALALCELAEKHPGYRLDRLRTIRIGGAAPSPDLIRRIRNDLCKEILIIYASTEASHAATARYEAVEHIPDAVGFIVPWAEVEIVDNSNNPLPPDTEGSVRYRTPYFLKNRDSNNSAEWFYPGDLGRITANRVLCITGRADDVINRGGTKFSATAVEHELMRCPGLKDAALCGIRGLSELLQVWLAVVPGENFDDTALRRFISSDPALGEKLETDIDRIAYVDRIPRNELGKIKRHELRENLLRLAKQASH